MGIADSVNEAITTGDWDKAALLAAGAPTGEVLPRDLIIQIIKGCGEAGLYSSALPLTERLTRIDPYNASYWYNLGLVKRKLQDFAGAEEAQQAALNVDPNHRGAQRERSKIARDRKLAHEQAEQAAAELERAQQAAAAQSAAQNEPAEGPIPTAPATPPDAAAQPFPPAPFPFYGGSRAWIALAAGFAVLVPLLALGGFVFLRQRAAERAYVEAAQLALAPLEKLDDGLKIGYNYVEFGTRLADANHEVEAFKRRYDEAPWSQRESYRAITDAAKAYEKSLDIWKQKIEYAETFSEKMLYESKLQKQWLAASTSLDEARRAISREQ